MKLEKLLAENMLRFGTKNVLAKHIKPYLMEQTRVTRQIYFGKYVASLQIAQLANYMKTYNPTSGPVEITDGNPWLATQRATALQNFLIEKFQGQFQIPFDANSAKVTQTVVSGKGDQNQYMKATIKAKLQKAPETKAPYPFDILYNFYDINGIPHILVTKAFGGSQSAPSMGDSEEIAIGKFKPFVDKTKNAILVQQYSPNAQTQTNTGVFLPILGGFAAKNKGHLYYNNFEDYNTARTYIGNYTDLGTSDIARSIKDPNATQANFTSTQGGGGNYLFGTAKSGTKVKILLGKDAGSEITLKRMESSKIGSLPGEILPGDEEKWFPIAEILYPGLFPDNLITIKPDMYKEIFDKIQSQIDELKAQGYNAIEMTAEIQGFASTDAANNRCPQGSEPDHTWGGSVTADKWITL